MVRFGDWEPKRRIERQFAKALSRVFAKIPWEAVLASSDAHAFLAELVASSEYVELLTLASSRMVTSLFTDNARTWRSAAREATRGREIYDLLRQEFTGIKGQDADELVRRRFWHIVQVTTREAQGIPKRVVDRSLRYIENETLSGRRAEDIANDIRKQIPQFTDAQVNRLSRTAVNSSQTAIVLTRMQGIGKEWYIWRTSKDARVRESHRHMDRVMVWIRDPPSPEKLVDAGFQGVYHAGQHWNCRCYPEPVIDLAYVSWPQQVHFQGTIRTMTRAEFERRFGNV